MDIQVLNPAIEQYMEKLLPPREPWFLEMEGLAERENFPAIGPQVGMLLELLARAIGAQRILELGSGFGYSGLWFARGLPENGYLLLTDFEEKNRELAMSFIRKAGVKAAVEFRTGDAREILTHLPGPFDIIFNDVDKEFYPEIIEPAHRLLRNGGLFITDNSLWHGRVAEEAREGMEAEDAATRSVKEFNRRLSLHRGFLCVQLPIRDGVALCIKTGDNAG